MTTQNTKPLLNVLIRTNNRPKGFNRLIESIEKQSFTNIRIIVSADNAETLEYVKDYDCVDEIVEVKRDNNAGRSPHNLYLNDLLKQVKEGFVIIIDDDDHVPDRYAFSRIMKELDPEKLNVVRMKWPNDRVIPEDEYFEQVPFTRKHIGMPCLVFHSDFADLVKFDAQRAADFRAANKMAEVFGVNWIDYIVVNTGNKGNTGAKAENWDIVDD